MSSKYTYQTKILKMKITIIEKKIKTSSHVQIHDIIRYDMI